MDEISQRTKKNQRVLVTTLTKRMAEDLTSYLDDMGFKVKYLHSDVETLERLEIIRDLRLGVFDVLVGINLLREGLDLPEVSLVAILDADKQGFLRSETSLIQTIGRAARNIEGRVIMYGDVITESMKRAISETNRRRHIQREYNKKYNITPKSVEKGVRDVIEATKEVKKSVGAGIINQELEVQEKDLKSWDPEKIIERLTREMKAAARNLEFEKAAGLRDKIQEIKGKRRN
jgi:excinuclease ABC subunit B